MKGLVTQNDNHRHIYNDDEDDSDDYNCNK